MAEMLLILGMHRSGTSAFAKGMEALGGTLGTDLLPQAQDNPKGFFEDRELQNVNDKFLLSQGSHWDAIHVPTPSRVERTAITQYQSQIWQSLAKKISGNQCFIFKDPRMSRLWPFWLPLLRDRMVTVKTLWVLRHPLAVAQSLQQRDGIPLALGLLLWDLHNRDIAQSLPYWSQITVSSYEALLSSPEETLGVIAHSLGFSVNKNLLEDFSRNFLDPSLNHSSPVALTVSHELIEFFAKRYQRALQPVDFLEKYGQIFGPYPGHLQPWYDALSYLSSARDELRLHASALQSERASTEYYVASLVSELEKRQEYATNLVNTLECKEQELQTQHLRLEDLQKHATNLANTLESKEQELQTQYLQLEDLRAKNQSLTSQAKDYKNRAHYLESLILRTRISQGHRHETR